MRLKVYRADRMADAMARIRTELGPDALILSSRRLGAGVEVTAALEEQDPVPPLAVPPAEPIHLNRISRHGIPTALAAALTQTPDLAAALAKHVTFQPLPPDRPLLLVGPPGAGKTLSAARLATRYVMGGASPTVITADGKRAGADEQLAAFTRLLNLSLLLAPDAVTLARALARPRPAGPVIIDCPGSDPFQDTDQTEIQAFAATAQATVALVLPAGLDAEESADLAQAYAQAGATHLIATRLDLARRFGGILTAAHTARLVLAEAGIGPGAADGLIPFTPDLLASRLLSNGSTP
jgi:flagellar biosynthesis protein FlhF